MTSKSKNQVVHEQKFKDLLGSLSSSERRGLDLELEVQGFNAYWGTTFCYWNFFHVAESKPLIPRVALLPISSSL